MHQELIHLIKGKLKEINSGSENELNIDLNNQSITSYKKQEELETEKLAKESQTSSQTTIIPATAVEPSSFNTFRSFTETGGSVKSKQSTSTMVTLISNSAKATASTDCFAASNRLKSMSLPSPPVLLSSSVNNSIHYASSIHSSASLSSNLSNRYIHHNGANTIGHQPPPPPPLPPAPPLPPLPPPLPDSLLKTLKSISLTTMKKKNKKNRVTLTEKKEIDNCSKLIIPVEPIKLEHSINIETNNEDLEDMNEKNNTEEVDEETKLKEKKQKEQLESALAQLNLNETNINNTATTQTNNPKLKNENSILHQLASTDLIDKFNKILIKNQRPFSSIQNLSNTNKLITNRNYNNNNNNIFSSSKTLSPNHCNNTNLNKYQSMSSNMSASTLCLSPSFLYPSLNCRIKYQRPMLIMNPNMPSDNASSINTNSNNSSVKHSVSFNIRSENGSKGMNL
jgi:hypothetical protein